MDRQANMAIKDKPKYDHLDSPSKAPKNQVAQTTTNLFHSILSSNLPVAEKRQDRIAQDGFVILVAGGETTARVLATATYHLLANPDSSLLNLKKELAVVMEDPKIRPDIRTLEQLPWLVCIP